MRKLILPALIAAAFSLPAFAQDARTPAATPTHAAPASTSSHVSMEQKGSKHHKLHHHKKAASSAAASTSTSGH
ncbi:MAG TPA: hypothetical protein VJ722_10030 [Rhodanobacteraceae bacterium]|nr:hypothetical protein [Rhodanobacteraceae bacterium]